MRLSVTQSAASVFYLGLIYFLFVVALLGAFEYSFAAPLLMPVVSITTSFICCVLAVLLIVLWKVTLTPQHKFYCLLLALLAMSIFSYLQWYLYQGDYRIDFITTNSPFSASLFSLIAFSVFIALIIKILSANKRLNTDNTTKLLLLMVILTGVGVWQLSAQREVHREEDNAREKVHLVEAMINKNLGEQTKALLRVKARIEGISSDNFLPLARIDMANYIQDYEIIEGILILDKDLNVVEGSDYALQFKESGMLASKAVTQWLNRKSETMSFATNGNTFDSATPILMLSVPITTHAGSRYQLLTLLNINSLIDERYIEYLSAFDVFVELAEDVYYSLNEKEQHIKTHQHLTNNYSYYIAEKINILGMIKYDVYSFVSNYQALERTAKGNQFILWLTFLFAFIFILASDSAKVVRKQAKKLFNMAKFDNITGLLRRDAINTEIADKALQPSSNNSAIVFLNLDGFKSVNNSLGHELGDKILSLVAQRLNEKAHGADSLARFGNDEFILYYHDTTSAYLDTEISEVLSCLAQVYYLGEVDIHLTASAGISALSKNPINAKILMQQADIAMDSAKRLGGNQLSFYEQQMDDRHKEIVWLRSELQKALKSEILDVYYQPIYCLKQNKVVAVESLVRWQHNGGFISPAQFIPMAEQTGQILQIGQQVLDKVLRDISATPALKDISVAINFSPQQLQKQSFINDLLAAVTAAGIAPKQLTLELTEMVMSEEGRTEVVLKALRDNGFNVAIDDFGTGYSSLSYLAKQPANIIKIDRAFTLQAEQPGQQQSLLHTIIKICTDLNKTVVVEGVESRLLLSDLAQFDDIRIQGYVYAKPMPLAQLVEHLNSGD